jgi:3-hydroxyisobutyrate dehydrogenase-like beta-hydroxyacid dehydrogenase
MTMGSMMAALAEGAALAEAASLDQSQLLEVARSVENHLVVLLS